jgi:hypothetical protein
MVFINTFGIQRLSWIKRNKAKRCKVLGADSEQQQDLGSLRKVQLKLERSYGQEIFLQAKAGLTLEQLGLEHLF